MSTSCIGDISIIEVYGNIFSVYFMLEELKNKSREKYHNVVPKCNKLTTRHMINSIHGDYWDAKQKTLQ